MYTVITHPRLNFSGGSTKSPLKLRVRMSNQIPMFYMDVITCPYHDAHQIDLC